MVMKHPEHDDIDPNLEDFFQAARAQPPLPRPAFMDTLVMDALAQQRPAARPASVLATLGQALGGWFGGAGLATAMALGLMLGVNFGDAMGVGMADVQEAAADEFAWLDDFAELTWEEF